MYIYIYVYIERERERYRHTTLVTRHLAFAVTGTSQGCANGSVTDGIGTPDPNPRNLVNWCF